MKYTKVFADQFGQFVFATREHDGLEYGQLYNAEGRLGPEQPLGTIEAFTHFSEWQPHAGPLPPAVQSAVDAAPQPAGPPGAL